ncbi:ShTK domain protein, partial [Trichostrongylus colubriformis]
DEYTYCREFSSLCTDPTFGDVMARHCTLTCKRCDDIEIKEEFGGSLIDAFYFFIDISSPPDRDFTTGTGVVVDYHENFQNFSCQQFVEDGFCNDEIYTNEERKHLCGSSCGLC